MRSLELNIVRILYANCSVEGCFWEIKKINYYIIYYNSYQWNLKKTL